MIIRHGLVTSLKRVSGVTCSLYKCMRSARPLQAAWHAKVTLHFFHRISIRLKAPLTAGDDDLGQTLVKVKADTKSAQHSVPDTCQYPL